MYVLKIVLIVLIIVIVLLIGLFYLFGAIFFHYDKKGEQTITYNQFVKLYSIAPNKYYIGDGYVKYNYINIYMKTYFDAIRLKIMCRNRDKKRLEARLDKERAELLKLWQEDVNAYHDGYLNDIKVYLKEGKIL